MIPKRIFFIWLGTKPNFVDFSISKYRTLNSDCDIQLIHYSISQLENLFFSKNIVTEIDQLVYNLIISILKRKKYSVLLTKLISGAYMINYSYTPFIQIFCDLLRIELLNVYGGIYVDCDTYPLKPFDEQLYKHEQFCVRDKVRDALVPNNYFIGSKTNNNIDDYFDDNIDDIVMTNNYQFINIQRNKPFDFMIRRIKFFKCILSDNDFISVDKSVNYFEHYSEFRWGRNKVPLTKFDKIFNRKQFLQ